MFNKGLTYFLPALLTAGNVERFAEMARWRISEAMSALQPEVDLDDLARNAMVEAAIAEALHQGWLRRSGSGTRSELIVDETYTFRGRRTLYGMEADDARRIYQAGRIFANRLSTSSKKWLSSEPVSTSRSGNPGSRRHVSVGR
jgi:hypothetical protein